MLKSALNVIAYWSPPGTPYVYLRSDTFVNTGQVAGVAELWTFKSELIVRGAVPLFHVQFPRIGSGAPGGLAFAWYYAATMSTISITTTAAMIVAVEGIVS